MALYDRWTTAFKLLLERNEDEFDNLENQRILILQIRRLNMYLAIAGQEMSPGCEMHWDRHMPVFVEMLSYAHQIVPASIDKGGDAHYGSQLGIFPHFSLEGGVILPLFLLASRCRHPVVRRAAIVIIDRLSRREGALNGSLVARVADRIVSIEEDGLVGVDSCQSVPEGSRLFCVRVWLQPGATEAKFDYSKRAEEQGKSRVVTCTEIMQKSPDMM
ncbi:hypothetical protein GQ53DRAFT_122608 [Thozetella sp. PMI_491]|nr:hypothetical protein GQ53DRAFT_122608 [Thozetella sp. PMI_491]